MAEYSPESVSQTEVGSITALVIKMKWMLFLKEKKVNTLFTVSIFRFFVEIL